MICERFQLPHSIGGVKHFLNMALIESMKFNGTLWLVAHQQLQCGGSATIVSQLADTGCLIGPQHAVYSDWTLLPAGQWRWTLTAAVWDQSQKAGYGGVNQNSKGEELTSLFRPSSVMPMRTNFSSSGRYQGARKDRSQRNIFERDSLVVN